MSKIPVRVFSFPHCFILFLFLNFHSWCHVACRYYCGSCPAQMDAIPMKEVENGVTFIDVTKNSVRSIFDIALYCFLFSKLFYYAL